MRSLETQIRLLLVLIQMSQNDRTRFMYTRNLFNKMEQRKTLALAARA
jgi:hypothetical protein